LALDSNYVNATSGDAIAARFKLPRAEVLNTVYYFVTAYTGTAANVNDLDLELRNNSDSTGPSSTLHEGKTHDPGATTGWRSSTGWSFSMSADTFYWIIIGDADGNGTDYATLLRNTNTFNNQRDYGKFVGVQTTDGWASVRTFSGAIASLVLVFASGRTIGNPLTASVNTTSNQNRRGLRFVAPATTKLFGMTGTLGTASTTITGIELWSGENGPSGSADATAATEIRANQIGDIIAGYAFETPPTITQGTSYRIVFTYGSNTTAPSKLNIGTGADASLRSSMLGGGNWYFAGANATTDWSNDDTSAMPGVDLLIEDFVTNSNLIVHPGMSGRLSG
jgi:hypothetical protein